MSYTTPKNSKIRAAAFRAERKHTRRRWISKSRRHSCDTVYGETIRNALSLELARRGWTWAPAEHRPFWHIWSTQARTNTAHKIVERLHEEDATPEQALTAHDCTARFRRGAQNTHGVTHIKNKLLAYYFLLRPPQIDSVG